MKSWDQKLSHVKFVHNHVVNRNTGKSLFEIVYRRLLRCSLDLAPIPNATKINAKTKDFIT